MVVSWVGYDEGSSRGPTLYPVSGLRDNEARGDEVQPVRDVGVTKVKVKTGGDLNEEGAVPVTGRGGDEGEDPGGVDDCGSKVVDVVVVEVHTRRPVFGRPVQT